jgi:hypothetical protein
MRATVQAFPMADTIRHPTIPPVRVNQACRVTLREAIVEEATAEEAATEVAAAINDGLPVTRTGLLRRCHKGF